MSPDQVPETVFQTPQNAGDVRRGSRALWILVVLAVLAIGEIYLLSQIGKTRKSLEAQQTRTREEISAQLSQQLTERFATLEKSNAETVEAMRVELEAASKRAGSAQSEVRRARALASKLEDQQKEQAEQLRQQIALKADQDQVGTLSRDVVNTRTELENTKKSIDSVRSDLGMARSEIGTLIARNKDEIEQLRQLGERDYLEFTLDKGKQSRVANIGLLLKKTNVGRHRFTVVVLADDMVVEKKDRTVNEPIFLFVGGSKRPYEVVVNKVEKNSVVGYVSVPKGAVLATTTGS